MFDYAFSYKIRRLFHEMVSCSVSATSLSVCELVLYKLSLQFRYRLSIICIVLIKMRIIFLAVLAIINPIQHMLPNILLQTYSKHILMGLKKYTWHMSETTNIYHYINANLNPIWFYLLINLWAALNIENITTCLNEKIIAWYITALSEWVNWIWRRF